MFITVTDNGPNFDPFDNDFIQVKAYHVSKKNKTANTILASDKVELKNCSQDKLRLPFRNSATSVGSLPTLCFEDIDIELKSNWWVSPHNYSSLVVTIEACNQTERKSGKPCANETALNEWLE